MDDADSTMNWLAAISAVTGLLVSVLLIVQSFRAPEKAGKMRIQAAFFLGVALVAWFVLRTPA